MVLVLVLRMTAEMKQTVRTKHAAASTVHWDRLIMPCNSNSLHLNIFKKHFCEEAYLNYIYQSKVYLFTKLHIVTILSLNGLFLNITSYQDKFEQTTIKDGIVYLHSLLSLLTLIKNTEMVNDFDEEMHSYIFDRGD